MPWPDPESVITGVTKTSNARTHNQQLEESSYFLIILIGFGPLILLSKNSKITNPNLFYFKYFKNLLSLNIWIIKKININKNPMSTLIRWAFKYIESVEPPDRMKDSFQLAL